MNDKLLIVEDEILIADYIKELLEEDNYKQIELAHNVDEALNAMRNFKPDVILMDINLNGVNSGIDLAKQKNTDAKVIYLTGQYDSNLMNQALLTNPESYLTKPIRKNDLIAAIKLVLLKQLTNSYSFKSGHLTVNLLFSEILYFKAEGNYVDIFTSDKKYTIRQSLSKCQDELPDHAPFMQTHRSYLVNSNHITQKTASTVYLGSVEIPLSRSYAKTLK